MSHTTKVDAPGWDSVVLIHNGDWSGPTTLRAWRKAHKPTTSPDVQVEIGEGEDRNVDLKTLKIKDDFTVGELLALFFAAGRVMGCELVKDAVEGAVERFS